MRIFAIAACAAFFLAHARAQTPETGKRQYQARCVGCHGEDGSGGGHGPSILDVRSSRATSKDAVRDLILKGIPDRGMPAFTIPTEEADLITAYVMKLKTPAAGVTVASEAAPGDPLAGKRFFTGKGNCTRCHMVRGRGGVL